MEQNRNGTRGHRYYGTTRMDRIERVERAGIALDPGRRVLPSCLCEGHEERMAAHTERVEREMAAIAGVELF